VSLPLAASRPAIIIGPNLREIVLAAERALANEPNVFQRAGSIVEVLRQEATPASGGPATGLRRTIGAPVIHAIAPAKLRLHLASCVAWQRERGDKLVATSPPDWAAHGLCGYGEWASLRPLTAVVEAPMLRADGSLLDTPGYDTATGLVYAPNLDFGRMPEPPTRADAQEASALLDRLVVDFPFESAAHRAGWKAGILTPFARAVIDGPCPLFLIDANVAAAGKGLLAELCALIFSGRVPALMSQALSEDEERKRITTVLLGGDPIILIDNLTGPFGSGALDAALTAREWCDRMLGSNRSVRLPLLATWWATGNNVILAGDTHRRVVHIRLESPLERPEEREDFAHRDLRAHALERRVEIVRAVLTLLSAYVQAGMPDMGLRTWGSFERWSAFIRGALVWAGDADPFEARAELIARSDTERAALTALIESIETKWPRGVTVAAILRLLEETRDTYPDPNAELRTAVAELCRRAPRSLRRRSARACAGCAAASSEVARSTSWARNTASPSGVSAP